MWTLSSIPSHSQASWPPPTTTTTKSARAHGPVTVSAKPRRQSPSLNNQDEDEDEDDDDKSVKTEEEEIDWVKASEEKVIGGSDILWALQKACAKKPKVKKQQQKREIASNNTKGAEAEAEKRNEERDNRNVKALCITSDWSKRLDDLESRLLDLTHS